MNFDLLLDLLVHHAVSSSSQRHRLPRSARVALMKRGSNLSESSGDFSRKHPSRSATCPLFHKALLLDARWAY